MARKGKVIRFWRGARQHPKWDLGTPPNPRGRKPYRAHRRNRGKWVLGGVMAVVLAGPVALDAASLLWRDSRGCRVWSVVDGDTVKINCPKIGNATGRIVGFDTPEWKAKCPKELAMAAAATFHLRWQLWSAREVVSTPRGQDRYGRVLLLMSVDGALVGTGLVEAGLARWYDGGQRKSWCGGAA
jgi:endonuclease YncB( thermonuclease family)